MENKHHMERKLIIKGSTLIISSF